MKTLIFINKALGLLLFPLVLYYIFTGYEYTAKHELLFYPELTGFFNSDNMVHNADEGGFIIGLFVLLLVTGARFIRFLMTLKETYASTLAKDSSENLSNILDIVYIYTWIRLCTSVNHMENPMFVIFLIVILGLGFIIWKIFEGVASTDNNDEGAFNFRDSVEDYYRELSDYSHYKENLIKNHKKLTT